MKGAKAWVLLYASLLMVLTPCSVRAQDNADGLDQATLINALAQEGMSELLLHLVETEKPDDPVVARQVKIAGLRIESQRLLAESSRAGAVDPGRAKALREQAEQAYQTLTDAMRSLIRDYDDHEQRPIWQTDLAQSLILDRLLGLGQSAPLFADFGVTTPEQDAALAKYAPEALALLSDAKLRLFNLRGVVGRDPARSQAMQSSGLFFRLFDEYDSRRTPYFLAYASYVTACLPDDAPYFADPGSADVPGVVGRELEPEAERARLLAQTDSELEKVINKLGGGIGIRDAAITLRARALLARGRYDPAIETVDELLQGEQRGVHWLTAALTRAKALDLRGSHEQALIELNQLRRDRNVIADMRYSLLVTDLTHRVMLAEAKRQPPTHREEAIGQSYQPYLELLTGPLTGEQAQGLRDFIYRRWEASLESSDDADTLPPMVRLAVSQVLRQQGQAILERLESTGDDKPGSIQEAAALRGEAEQKLANAIRLAETLTGTDIEPAIRSEAMFNLAIAMHHSDPVAPANRLKLTTILTDLADQMPAEPVAEDAITASVALLRELHQVLPTPVEVEEAYERAVAVLFSKFPTSEAADGERLYYGYAVLARAGRTREAIDTYLRVPFDHDDYFRAQRQAMLSLMELDREASPGTKPRIRRELDSLMRRIETEAEHIHGSMVNPDRAETARRAVATVRLVKAHQAMDDGDFDSVIEHLSGFESAYPKQEDLIAESLELRIVALGDAGRHEALAEAARKMVTDYPAQAAPVIDQVLTQTERRIEAYQVQAAKAGSEQRKELLEKAQAQAQAAAVLSGYLLDWAATQDFDTETMMPFEVVRAKTLRLAGKTDEAYALLSRLVHDFPNDAQVMLEYAQALYDKGDEDSLVEAVRFYDRLITGLGAPYPPEWWTAWMRRLQINDRMNEGTAEIPLRVRQLRMTDPALGGPITKLELERLEHKYAR